MISAGDRRASMPVRVGLVQLTGEQVEENTAASDLGPLPLEARSRIERIYAQHEFFLGKAAQAGRG